MNPSGPALSSGRTLGRATASLVVAARSRIGPRLRDRARGAAGHCARLVGARAFRKLVLFIMQTLIENSPLVWSATATLIENSSLVWSATALH